MDYDDVIIKNLAKIAMKFTYSYNISFLVVSRIIEVKK